MTAAGFAVTGQPIPQGSMKKANHGGLIASNDKLLRPWRKKIVASVRSQVPGTFPIFERHAPVIVTAVFTVSAPQNARKTIPNYPAKKPDLDKLLRALFDGISDSGLWVDDGQATRLRDVFKTYPSHVLGADDLAMDEPGVRVLLTQAGELRG